MKIDLKPPQWLLLDHGLNTPRGAWFASMGIGKTSAALSLIDTLQRRTLVVAPLRVARHTWPKEARTFDFAGGVSAVVGTPQQRIAALKKDVLLYTINYENIPWLLETLKGWPFDFVVCDESTRIKNYRVSGGGSKRAAALHRVAWSTKRWLAMTGAPIPAGYKDLWGQVYYLDKGHRLGDSFDAFENRFYQPVRQNDFGFTKVLRPGADKEIQDLIKDLCITVRSEDFFKLTAPIESKIYFGLPVKAQQHYRELEKDFFTVIAREGIEAFTASALTMKLRQLASGFLYNADRQARWVHDSKLEALNSVYHEAGGTPILVAYHFKASLAAILKKFPFARVLDKKQQTLDDWNAGKIPMLLAHPASAGHGLNLQHGGNILVFFEIDFNLDNHAQVIERIGPMRQLQAGYKRNVFIYYLMADDTLDDYIFKCIVRKADVQNTFLTALIEKG